MNYYLSAMLMCDCAFEEERTEIYDSIVKHGLSKCFEDKWSYGDDHWRLYGDDAEKTWQDLASEFKAVSAEFPNVHFEIYTEEDDYDDMTLHFVGGKMQACHMEDEFDPKKLK